MEHASTSQRAAARSRAAILDAATELFAEQGCGTTTLQAVGVRSGLSRGTPGYFFGSNPGLYAAVLQREFRRAGFALMAAGRDAAAQGLSGAAAFRHALDAYIDFLVQHPSFVRLVEWEALGHGPRLGTEHLDVAMAALGELGDTLREQLPRALI